METVMQRERWGRVRGESQEKSNGQVLEGGILTKVESWEAVLGQGLLVGSVERVSLFIVEVK
jgi:hypothetical protein